MADLNIKIFKITFLGTSAASLSPRSSTSASLVEVGNTKIIVDAGIGALRQLLKSGTSPDMLDAVLITHWHIDHCAGLPGLIRARRNPCPLPIYGPVPPFSIRLFFRAIFPSIFKYFTQVRGTFFTDIADIYIEAFETTHKIPSIGWALTDKPLNNRRVVFTGDTRPTKTIIKAACGADLLIHEATYLKKHLKRAIAQRHSTAAEAASIALKSRVGGLALTHIPSRYSLKAIRMEVEQIFPGVIILHPMTVIYIDPLMDESKKEGAGWARLKILA